MTPYPTPHISRYRLRFPHKVLRTIVASMPIVQRLATSEPTALYEEYLHYAWARAPLGPPPRSLPASLGA